MNQKHLDKSSIIGPERVFYIVPKRDFDKEYSNWKKDTFAFLIIGFVLGFIAGILI